MFLKPFATGLIMMIFSCDGTHSQQRAYITEATTRHRYNAVQYEDVGSIPEPDGFTRPPVQASSFGYWLRGIKLKKDNTVYLFNGQPKRNQSAQFAVLDISVGEKDLQQCADAAMRLRAEYLFEQKQYNDIRFLDNAGTLYQFKPPYTRANFQPYLNRVFGMCGTASLQKQLDKTNAQELKPGDLIIKGGFPGHAVIVADMAVNTQGEKVFLLAQSYMPAQDIHILVNPRDERLSPWYQLSGKEMIETPEWTFNSNQFKTW